VKQKRFNVEQIVAVLKQAESWLLLVDHLDFCATKTGTIRFE